MLMPSGLLSTSTWIVLDAYGLLLLLQSETSLLAHSLETERMIQPGFASDNMSVEMISLAAHAAGDLQLNPEEGSSKTMVPNPNNPKPHVLLPGGLYQIAWSKRGRAPCKVATSNQLLFLFSVTLIIAGAQGDHQTGLCELLDPAISLDVAATPETIGLSPRPSTEPVPAERTNGCIPHVVLHAENPGSPDHSGPPSPVGEKLQWAVLFIVRSPGVRSIDLWEVEAIIWRCVMGMGFALIVQVGMGFALIVQVGMGLAILVTMGTTAWMLWRRWPTFTEDDINRGLMREPAVARRDDPTFDIPERFPETSNA